MKFLTTKKICWNSGKLTEVPENPSFGKVLIEIGEIEAQEKFRQTHMA